MPHVQTNSLDDAGNKRVGLASLENYPSLESVFTVELRPTSAKLQQRGFNWDLTRLLFLKLDTHVEEIDPSSKNRYLSVSWILSNVTSIIFEGNSTKVTPVAWFL